MPKKTTAYTCNFNCGVKGFDHPEILEHEKWCWANPKRNFGKRELREGDDCPYKEKHGPFDKGPHKRKRCKGKLVRNLNNIAKWELRCNTCWSGWGVRKKRNISTGITTEIWPLEKRRDGEPYAIDYRGGVRNLIPKDLSTKEERRDIRAQGGG